MPLTDETHTIRLTSVSAALMRSMLSRLTASTESHSSSLMRARVRSRVMPALWTTMSARRSASVARPHLGDRRADPARGARHHGRLAGQRPGPVLGYVPDRGGDADDLAGHVGRAAGEQEAQRRLEIGVGIGVDELRGGAVADLLAGRAHEALEPALGHAVARPDDDQPPAG